MSATSGVNVLRWIALGLGVCYGVSHQSSIHARDRLARLKAEYARKAELIAQAKRDWARLQSPQAAGGDVVSDPADPRFDLEKLLAMQK